LDDTYVVTKKRKQHKYKLHLNNSSEI